jgi:hypothetical protein
MFGSKWILNPRSACLILLAGFIFMLASGCSDVRHQTCSGLLDNYNNLTPMKYQKGLLEDSNAVFYEKKYVNWNRYSQVVVEPVKIAPSAKYADLNPKDFRDVSIYMQKSLIEAFRKDYAVVQAPGRYGTLIIDAEVTDIDQSSPAVNLFTMMAMKVPVDTAGITMEIKVKDAATGESLCELIAFGNGNPIQILESLDRFGQAKVVMDDWSSRLATRIRHQPVGATAMANAQGWKSSQVGQARHSGALYKF